MFGPAALLLLTLAPLQFDGGTSGPCPNERACDVDARISESGTARTCGLGISLFGWDISVGGETCYPYRYSYPAHQECHGKRNVGTYCAFEQTLSVTAETCDCGNLGVLGTGITLPDCVCTAAGNAGTLSDFKTANCAPPASTGGGSGHSGG